MPFQKQNMSQQLCIPLLKVHPEGIAHVSVSGPTPCWPIHVCNAGFCCTCCTCQEEMEMAAPVVVAESRDTTQGVALAGVSGNE